MGASPNQGLVKVHNSGNSHTNWFHVKLNLNLPDGPATPLLDIYLREMKTCVHTRNVCVNVHSSFIPSHPGLEATKCSTGEWMNTLWQTHIMEY